MFFSDAINKPHTGKVPAPYQAVIFSEDEYKSKISALTRGVPSTLLPIANQPALHYILNWLEKGNIKEVILVLSPSANLQAEAQLTHYLTKVYQGPVKVELYPVDVSVKSVQALSMLKHKINGNFLVFGTSFICDVPLTNILNEHSKRLPLMTSYFYENSKIESNSSEHVHPNIIGIEPNLGLWVYNKKHSSEDDLTIKMSLLNKYPRVNFYKNLYNSDLYIFSPWILDFISNNNSLTTICDDLIPLLVKLQSRNNLNAYDDLIKCISSKPPLLDPLVNQYITSSGKNSEYVAQSEDKINCNIITQKTGIHGKLDSIPSYFDLNRQFAKFLSPEERIPGSVEKETTAQIGPDSVVGTGTKLSERTSIKKSIIGAHCTIGKQVKIANTIIMDHVVIEDNVKLENCIVCSNAVIMEKANLKECEVSAAIKVEKNVAKKGEAIID
ncbi:hypothetical protein K502DRAFT_343953 [Neoconidiobolus thromboides FSU 785]|nr:hypothetical protein K502DRAFT_343953 [Neoconidiobolus thromboides FSU 785]